MPEPGMGSVGGGGLGGGLLSDKDDKDDVSMGGGPSSEGAKKGYYSYERSRWIGGPEESYSAVPDVAPVSKIEMYLDETPALQPQIDYSAAAAAANKAAAERARTMGATMGGGPSYDPLVTGEEDFPDNDYNTEAEAASWPLELHANLRKMSGYKETKKGKHSGMHSARWHPDFAKWSDAKQRDFLAGFDKTLGAAGRYSRNKQAWENKATQEEKQIIWDKVTALMEKNLSEENLERLMNAGYNMTQLTSILNPENAGTIRDIIRHGIATNKYGLMKMTAYETFTSGQELSDYINNLAAYRFAKNLNPGQDFDEEWAAAVIQEKMNPGSTGLNLNWSASTEDDLTAGGWWANLWADYKQGGLLGGPAANPAAGGMITQAEQGGG
jgi:hypothetical protein